MVMLAFSGEVQLVATEIVAGANVVVLDGNSGGVVVGGGDGSSSGCAGNGNHSFVSIVIGE